MYFTYTIKSSFQVRGDTSEHILIDNAGSHQSLQSSLKMLVTVPTKINTSGARCQEKREELAPFYKCVGTGINVGEEGEFSRNKAGFEFSRGWPVGLDHQTRELHRPGLGVHNQ